MDSLETILTRLNQKVAETATFTLGAGTENELTLNLKPVSTAKVLLRLGSTGMSALTSMSDSSREVVEEIIQADPERLADAIEAKERWDEAYIVHGVVGPITFCHDDQAPKNGYQFSINWLKTAYPNDWQALEQKIRAISGEIKRDEVVADSKSAQ